MYEKEAKEIISKYLFKLPYNNNMATKRGCAKIGRKAPSRKGGKCGAKKRR